MATLSDIGLLASGHSPPESTINHDGRGTPYITGPEQWNGEEIVVDRWTTASVNIVPGNSIFIILRGSVGSVFPGIRAAVGRGVAAFIPYEPLNREYLILALRDICKSLAGQARGQIPGISRSDLLSLQIPIPPLAEQQRIVSALEDADDLLQQSLEQIATSRVDAAELRESLLTDAFLGTSTASWRRSQSADAVTVKQRPDEPVKADAAPVVRGRYALALGNPVSSPVETWRWARLAEVADLRTGHTPSRREPDYWNGDIPWIGVKDARDHYGEVIYDTSQHITESGLAKSAAEVLPIGTLCLSRTAASIGYVVVTGRPMATSQDFINWTCGPTVDPTWLLALFIAERETFPDFGRGSVHKTIYLDDANRIYVLLPPLDEQGRIVVVIREGLDRLSRAEVEIDKAESAARTARAAATRAALRGGLHTADVDDEPAAELLARLDRDVEVLRVAASTPPGDDGGPTAERLVRTVRDSSEGLSPEALFAAAGYRKDAVDLFFAHLKSTVESNQLRYDASADVLVSHET